MRDNLFCVILIFIFSINHTIGQDLVQPKFSNFKGNVYSIHTSNAKKGYGKHIFDYEQIGTVDWKRINVPIRFTDDKFPDVNKKTFFCIVFESTLTIKKNSCYEFSLNSDDGSILWINDQLILDNAKSRGGVLKKETIMLEEGIYKIKIWYEQTYPNRYGITFNAENIGDDCKPGMVLNKERVIEKKETPIEKKKITFEAKVLFQNDEFKIQDESIPYLDSISQVIKEANPSRILIVGHTDNKGSNKYNLELSNKRAEELKKYLINKINQPGIGFISKGEGENFPIATNDTEEGRMKNRRVELIIIP